MQATQTLLVITSVCKQFLCVPNWPLGTCKQIQLVLAQYHMTWERAIVFPLPSLPAESNQQLKTNTNLHQWIHKEWWILTKQKCTTNLFLYGIQSTCYVYTTLQTMHTIICKHAFCTQPLRELLTSTKYSKHHTTPTCMQVRAYAVHVSDKLLWGYKTWPSCLLLCPSLSNPWWCHSFPFSLPNSLCQGCQPMHSHE